MTEQRLTDEQVMHAIINACDSLNITRVHGIVGPTRTICDEAGLLEIGRAVLALASPPVAVQEEGDAKDAALEALELVAMQPATRGVYVLDQQDMDFVKRAVKALKGDKP